MNFTEVKSVLDDMIVSSPECYRSGLFKFGDVQNWIDRVALEVVLNAPNDEKIVMSIFCDSLLSLNVAILSSYRLVVLSGDATVIHDLELVSVGKVEHGPGVLRITSGPRDLHLYTRDDFRIHNFARELQRLAR